jgi:TetR/AcrR family transcriptional regulator, mexJK operon transcriptional repressor
MDATDFLEHENARRILDEAWRLFQEKGYRGVTVDELCQRCALSKPTLYYYFGDKENLFVQLLRHKLHGFREMIEQPGTLTERLKRVVVAILDSFETDYTSLLRDRKHLKRPESLEEVRCAFRSELFGPLAALMQEGMVNGDLQADEPATLALFFLGAINNFVGRSAEMEQSHVALAQKLTDYFLNGTCIR